MEEEAAARRAEATILHMHVAARQGQGVGFEAPWPRRVFPAPMSRGPSTSLLPLSAHAHLRLQELAMLEYELLHFRPSHVASAATLLAQLYMKDTQSLRWGGANAAAGSLWLLQCVVSPVSVQNPNQHHVLDRPRLFFASKLFNPFLDGPALPSPPRAPGAYTAEPAPSSALTPCAATWCL